MPLPAMANQINITGVDRSNYPTITLSIDVVDAQGKIIDLSGSTFSIYENGQIVAKNKAPLSKLMESSMPLAFSFLIDTSSSMGDEGKLEQVKSVVSDLLQAFDQPRHSASLGAFTTSVKFFPFVSPPTQLQKDIDALVANGGTSIDSAIIETLEHHKKQSNNRSIVMLLTDGEDSIDVERIFQTLDQSKHIQLFIIGLENQSNLEQLKKIASYSGGRFMSSDTNKISQHFSYVKKRIRNNIQITYTSPSTLADGMNRNIRVTMNQQGQQLSSQQSYRVSGVVGAVQTTGSTLIVALLWFMILVSTGILWKNKGWV